MKSNLRFTLSIMTAAILTIGLSGCFENPEDFLNGSNPAGNAQDVSSRITGFSPAQVGGGSVLTINGSNLADVDKILLGESTWIDEFTATDNAVEFTVPSFAPLGENSITLIFDGPERAFGSFEVIPNPGITYFTPKAAASGETVTVLGNNLTFVGSVSIGGVDAPITGTTSDTRLTFTMPAEAETDVIVLNTTTGGTVESEDIIIACTAEPGSFECLPTINTNGSFESSAIGPADGVQGWGGLNGSLASGEITDEDYIDGFQCVKMTINELGANPWNIQPTVNVTVDPAGTYRLSMWVKGTGIANAKFALDQAGTPGFAELANPELSLTDNAWQQIVYEFSPASEAVDANPPGDEQVRLAISLSYEGNVGGVLFMDHLRIIRIDQ